MDTFREFVHRRVAEHRETYDENNIRDFIDLYIQTTKKPKEEMSNLTGINNFVMSYICGIKFIIIAE